jgi:hypothetical protein
VAFTHRKRIILQCRVVSVVRGGEMYGKGVRAIERGGFVEVLGVGEGIAGGGSTIRNCEKRKMMDISTDLISMFVFPLLI